MFWSRSRICTVMLSLVGFLTSSGAATRPSSPKSSKTGAEYTYALAAADRFLQAWQGGDIETGIVMLTSRAKSNIDHDRLDRLFSRSAPAAYEIQHGKCATHGRCTFPVTLHNSSLKRPQGRLASLVILNTGNNDWAVDNLP
ncbi:MAG TPA: hypothetical protein VI386_01185 [Candidatus Sulfotelmatobacter sp.]